MKIRPLLLTALIVLGLASPALAYRGSGRIDTDKQPNQSKQRYSYVSVRRAGSGRRSMRKESIQVAQTWTLEWTAPGETRLRSETFTNYDSCNAKSKALVASGASISKYCLNNWDLN